MPLCSGIHYNTTTNTTQNSQKSSDVKSRRSPPRIRTQTSTEKHSDITLKCASQMNTADRKTKKKCISHAHRRPTLRVIFKVRLGQILRTNTYAL